jgi:hypothetical protein
MSRRHLSLGLAFAAGILLIAVITGLARSVQAGNFPVFLQDSTPPPLNTIVVVRAYYDDPALVATLGPDLEPWAVYPSEGYVELGVSQDQITLLSVLGFRVEVDQARTDLLNTTQLASAGQQGGIPGYACYRTVTETATTATNLVGAYPSLITTVDIGDSWKKVQDANAGYDLITLVLSNQNTTGPKPVLFVTTGVHAREYAPPELATRFAEYLLAGYGTDPDATWLLDHHEIHLLINSNPDSRVIAENQIYWRKNQNNSNGCSSTLLPNVFGSHLGTDLNRNFDFQWGCCGGSNAASCSETYRGASAASEPETQAIQAYTRSIFPDQRGPALTDAAPANAMGVAMDIHSYGDLVLWPWGFGAALAPNGTALQTMGRKLAFFNDYYPEQAIGLYPTDGTTDDFFYGDLGVAAFAYEIGDWFFQDCSTFEATILPDNLDSLLFAARVSRAPYLLPSGPDALNLSLSSLAVQAGQSVTLTVTLDDQRFNNDNGAEPAQNIAAAVLQVDVPYWVTATQPISHSMVAADGAFNSPAETAQALVDTTGLTPGNHLIFARGQDASGNWGPVGAVFLEIVGSGMGSVQGIVQLQGRSDHSAAVVSAWQGAALVMSTTSALDGAYVMALAVGDYDLTVELGGYLHAQRESVSVQDGAAVQLPLLSLLAGDPNGDGIDNILDISLLGGQYGLTSSDAGWNPAADLNQDGVVNILDLTPAGNNFGLESSPWP